MDILIFAVFVVIFSIGVFATKTPGYGQYNVQIVNILFVATFATLLAIIDPLMRTASIGILGAIAGYLFGIKEVK